MRRSPGRPRRRARSGRRGAELLDHVPVHRARVDAADEREPGADREVDRSVDLLVEERVPHVPLDPRVAADPELAEPPRALVGVERGDQELLVRPSPTPRRPCRPRSEAHALADRALVDGGELGVLDHALGRVLERRGEELAARHVVVRVVDEAAAAGDRQRQVGAGADDTHLSAASNRSAYRSSARARRPSRAGRRRRRSPRSRRASSRPPGRTPRSGRGSRPRGSRCRAAAGRSERTPSGASARRSGAEHRRRRACSPSPKTSIHASSSSRVRASLGAIVAEQLLGRLARPEAVERHLLLVDERQPDERPRAAAARSGGRSPRPAAAQSGVAMTITCQPGWTSSERSTRRRAYCSTRGSTKAPIRRFPGRPCRRARSGRRSGAP